jgi:hypothetical protein
MKRILNPNRAPVKKLTLDLGTAKIEPLDMSKPLASSSTLSGTTIKPIVNNPSTHIETHAHDRIQIKKKKRNRHNKRISKDCNKI